MSSFARQKEKARTGNPETRCYRKRSTTELELEESGSSAPHRPEGALCLPGSQWPGSEDNRRLLGCSCSRGPPPPSLPDPSP